MSRRCPFCIISLYNGDDCASIEPGWAEISEKGGHVYFEIEGYSFCHPECVRMRLRCHLELPFQKGISHCAICADPIEPHERMTRIRYGSLIDREGELDEGDSFHENYFHPSCLLPLVGEDVLRFATDY